MQGIWDGIAHADQAATEAEQSNKRVMRILTVSERQHGLSNALTALLGQQTGSSWEKVADALCEVMASAMLALASITPEPELTLGRYVGTADPAPRCEGCGIIGGTKNPSAHHLNCPNRAQIESQLSPGTVMLSGIEEAEAIERLNITRAAAVVSLAQGLGNPAVDYPESHATDGDSLS